MNKEKERNQLSTQDDEENKEISYSFEDRDDDEDYGSSYTETKKRNIKASKKT